MGNWWNEWRIWAMMCYHRIPSEPDKLKFLKDVMNVVGAAVIAFADMPDLSNAWKSPLKLVRWGLKNPDPFQEARRRAIEVKTKWAAYEHKTKGGHSA